MAGQVSDSEVFFSLFEVCLFSFSSFFDRRRLDCPDNPIKPKLDFSLLFHSFPLRKSSSEFFSLFNSSFA